MFFSVKIKKTLISFTSLFCSTLIIFVIVFSIKAEETENKTKDYITWLNFNATASVMKEAVTIDIESQNKGKHIDWIEIISLCALKTGNKFDKSYAREFAEIIKSGKTAEEIAGKNIDYYKYYYEAYSAALSGFLGEYETVENGEKIEKYGVKVFSPIAKSFPYYHYDDFGSSRTYGFKRKHLGNDLMGQVGTPIVAIESGIVEIMGWNQYGGWRIGIRSFDKKRYYYYAHLRKGYPYKLGLKEGDTVQAGDVIGYMGRTGYSTTEDVNNIEVSHLHFGLQLIFDESQKEGENEIWIDVYQIIEFLDQYKSAVSKTDIKTKDYNRVNDFYDKSTPQ